MATLTEALICVTHSRDWLAPRDAGGASFHIAGETPDLHKKDQQNFPQLRMEGAVWEGGITYRKVRITKNLDVIRRGKARRDQRMFRSGVKLIKEEGH